MRTAIVLSGLALNAALLLGIIYLHNIPPRSRATLPTPATKNLSAHLPTKSIGLLIPGLEKSVEEGLGGIYDGLAGDIGFKPEVKVYNGNRNRTLMRSNVEAAIEANHDLLFTHGSQCSQMAKELSAKRQKDVPVVFYATGDPIKLGLVDDPDASGNNLTGVSVVGLEWVDQMVDLIPLIAPFVKKVLIPYDPTGLGGSLEMYKQRFDAALIRNGIESFSVQVYETNEITSKVTPFVNDCDMIMILPDGTLLNGFKQIAKLSQQYGKAIYVAQNMGTLKEGATFCFGYHPYDVGIAAVQSARRILEDGVKPTDIPTNRLENTYRLGFNVEAAREQGVYDKMDAATMFLMENGEVV